MESIIFISVTHPFPFSISLIEGITNLHNISHTHIEKSIDIFN